MAIFSGPAKSMGSHIVRQARWDEEGDTFGVAIAGGNAKGVGVVGFGIGDWDELLDEAGVAIASGQPQRMGVFNQAFGLGGSVNGSCGAIGSCRGKGRASRDGWRVWRLGGGRLAGHGLHYSREGVAPTRDGRDKRMQESRVKSQESRDPEGGGAWI